VTGEASADLARALASAAIERTPTILAYQHADV